jgi:hypothetical protein
MTIILAALGVAFAAFCVWLTVRVVNRKDRWAKWTAAWLAVALIAGYPLSVGPALWMEGRGWFSDEQLRVGEQFYMPLTWLLDLGGQPSDLLWRYVKLWIDP